MATLNHNQRNGNPQKNHAQNDDFGCSAVQTHLHAYVEGELDSIRTGLLKGHMEDCSTCREQAEELKLERVWLLEACVDSPALPDSFTQKVMLRVKEEKRAQAGRVRRAVYLRFGGGALAAAAAVVMVSVLAVLQNSSDHKPEGTKVAGVDVATVEVPGHPAPKRRFVSVPHGNLRDLQPPGRTRVIPRAGSRFGGRVPAPRFANFGHVVGMAAARLSHTRDRDPCEPDPNQDGKTDWNDVAYSCQVILSGQPPSPLDVHEAVSEATLPDPDCENVCRA